MILNPAKIASGTILETDVCVVGAGPAGLALFSDLDKAGVELCLLESGDLTAKEAPDDYFELGGPTAELPATSLHVRGFGGTTHLWTGVCAFPDRIDFEQRDFDEPSGWPLAYDDLLPFCDRAMAFFGLVPDELRVDSAAYAEDDPSAQIVYRSVGITRALRTGGSYLAEARRSPSSRIFLGATAYNLDLTADGRFVEMVHVRGADGRTFFIKARKVVLATGGIEAPRLLLASARAGKADLDSNGNLGRYFMERCRTPVGYVVNTAAQPMTDRLLKWRPISGGRAYSVASLSPHIMRQRRLRGFWVRAHDILPGEGAASVSAHKRLWAALKSGERPIDVPARLKELAADPLSVLRYYGMKAGKQLRAAQVPGTRTLLFATTEPAPRAENRIVLSDRTNRFGDPLARILFRPAPDHLAPATVFAEALAASGLAQVIPVEDSSLLPEDLTHKDMVAHAMGATRMAVDPKNGVVDRDCRVHGIANLWIASSSVFPVAGSANPTVTIVALALLVADRLLGRSTG